MRQPYLQNIISKNHYQNFPVTEHIHFYGFYLGNFPTLKEKEILEICKIINNAD